MRVVVAHNRYGAGQPSGENAVVTADIEQLGSAGVEVLPFLRSSDSLAEFGPARRAALAGSVFYARSAQRELRALLRRTQPDVVHLHNPYPLLSPWIVRTAQAAGVPVVQTVHNYRQVCANGVFFRDGAICTLCAGRRLAVPAVVHGCYRGSRAQSAVMAGALAAHRGTWRRVDRFLAPTSAVEAYLRGYGIPAGRITVKPNAVPDPGPPAPLGDGFLFLGRLVPEKGLALLIEAWSRHPVGSLGRLRIAGDGPERALATSFAAGRSDVEYLGPLSPALVSDALRSAAVLVVPSRWHDVLPTVVLEALAAGRPVLGTDLGGLPYAIGEAGWAVPAAALTEVLPVALAQAPALAAAARDRYLSSFHPSVVTGQLLAAYASLPRRSPPGKLH